MVLGQGIDALARSYPDTPCGGIVAQHFQGAVHNTVVWAKDSGLAASAGGIVDGIAVENSCEVEILHNTVHLGASPTDGSIIHRYANTSGIVANNLTHNTIRRQDGAVTVSNHNIENMPDNTWVSIGTGDFHLAPATVDPIDAGDPQWLTSVPQDVDGHDRAPTPDAGIDER